MLWLIVLIFAGSGETDGGLSVSLSFELDSSVDTGDWIWTLSITTVSFSWF